VPGEAASSGTPSSGAGKFAGGERKPGDPGTFPRAISGLGAHGAGLSSANEPETWDVSQNAATYDATDVLAEQAGSISAAPAPLELLPDDIIRMSVLWGTVDDEVPSGMTIKSLEEDEIDEANPTLNVEEMQNAEDLDEAFRADESSQTFSPVGEDSDGSGDGKIGDTVSTDDIAPQPSAGPGQDKDWSEASVNETFLSDEFSELGDVGQESKSPSKPGRHDTPPEALT
jgi:hypothetical protein